MKNEALVRAVVDFGRALKASGVPTDAHLSLPPSAFWGLCDELNMCARDSRPGSASSRPEIAIEGVTVTVGTYLERKEYRRRG